MKTTEVPHALAAAPGADRPAQVPAAPGVPLTAREKQVWDLICQGLGSGEIARAMGIGCNTVGMHKANLRKKGLDVPRWAAAARRIENGLRQEMEMARDRVAREVADGSRCERCHLLLPHDGCSREARRG